MTSELRVSILEDQTLVLESLERLIDTEADMRVVGRAQMIGDLVAELEWMRPDVLIVDYWLPDGTGMEVLNLVRETAPNVATVMLTGFADEGMVVDAVRAGCTGFVMKEQAAVALVSAVRAASRNEASIPPRLLPKVLPILASIQRKPDLSPREMDVLKLMAQGFSTIDIADQLTLSRFTIRNHVQSILSKLDAHSKLEAVAAAVRLGMVRFGEDGGPASHRHRPATEARSG